jgi:hypothetical protein
MKIKDKKKGIVANFPFLYVTITDNGPKCPHLEGFCVH